MYGLTIINVVSWFCDNIAIITSMATAIGALWKFNKQQELAITLQKNKKKHKKNSKLIKMN